MKVASYQCTHNGATMTLWKVEWLLGKKATRQTMWFFTEQEATAAVEAVTAHCASYGVNPSHLPRAAVELMIAALRQGKGAILFVSPNCVAIRNELAQATAVGKKPH